MNSTQKFMCDDFEQRIRSFIDVCKDTGTEPTDYQLCLFLDISPITLEEYYNGNGINEGFDKVLEILVLFREDHCIRQAIENPRLTGYVTNKLKQARWGGWVDRPFSQSKQDVAVKFNIPDEYRELCE